MKRLIFAAFLLVGCAAALAATTGISTTQARTAAPTNGVNLSLPAASGIEGTSLAFMRSDATLGVTSPSCSGKALTSSGGGLSCATALSVTSISGLTSISSSSLTWNDPGGMTVNADVQMPLNTLQAATLEANAILSLGNTNGNFERTAVSAGAPANGTDWFGTDNEWHFQSSSVTYTVAPLKAGAVALTSGTPSTKTVTLPVSGMVCTCTETTTATNNANLKCAVSTTTLTITGPNSVTDTIAYTCMVAQ